MLACVSAEERTLQLERQNKFVNAIPKVEDWRELKDIESMSIRDRLCRRLNTTTIKVPFEDDYGQFNIELRLMDPKEQNNLMALYAKLSTFMKTQPEKSNEEAMQKLVKEGQELLSEIYQMVGTLCVDPELNAEFWKEGKGFNLDVPLKLIGAAVSESQKVQKQVRKFRKE